MMSHPEDKLIKARDHFTYIPTSCFPISGGSDSVNSSEMLPSSSKRKRTVIDDGSDASSSCHRPACTSDFNSHTKAHVRNLYSNKCWHCGASPTDVCHVIGDRDNTFQEALTDGLIDFQEKQNPQNTIALCGTCHTNFDHVYNPSFFFLPTDLNYFLHYERQDRKRRRKLGRRKSTIPARICPTAQTYQAHQIHQGVEGARLGGLYTRIVTNNFLPEYPGRAPFQPGPSEYGAIKSWTGSPMASLRHAVLMLRKLNLRGIPRDIIDTLRQLQDLYSKELDLNGPDTSSQGSIDPRELDENDLEEGRGGNHEHKPGTKSQQSGAEERSASGDIEQDNEEHEVNKEEQHKHSLKDKGHMEINFEVESSCHNPEINCMLEPDNNSSQTWRWGPSATSNDVVKFFRLVM